MDTVRKLCICSSQRSDLRIHGRSFSFLSWDFSFEEWAKQGHLDSKHNCYSFLIVFMNAYFSSNSFDIDASVFDILGNQSGVSYFNGYSLSILKTVWRHLLMLRTWYVAKWISRGFPWPTSKSTFPESPKRSHWLLPWKLQVKIMVFFFFPLFCESC